MNAITTFVTIMDVVKGLLPKGTRPDQTWDLPCEWPPDLFAVVGTITERSGLYSKKEFRIYWDDNQWAEDIRQVGERWGRTGEVPAEVFDLWKELVTQHREDRVADAYADGATWTRIVFRLLAIADQACDGVGFLPLESEAQNKPQSKAEREPGFTTYLYYDEYKLYRKIEENKRIQCSETDVWRSENSPILSSEEARILPYIPHSLCIGVPPDIVCVQPKTNTPGVGCTLRSLTLHLALLPCVSTVKTYWDCAPGNHRDDDAFNVLLVPFPFLIPGKSFDRVSGNYQARSRNRSFKLNPQLWLGDVTARHFADFLLGLVKKAHAELEPVHAIILPECALRLTFAEDVANILAKESTLDLFLSGVMDDSQGSLRNLAVMYRFVKEGNKDESEKRNRSLQSKHHRWCLNDSQIRRYHLGHVLDPDYLWWEHIDVSERSCNILLFRPQATLSVLVCEDLARYDPVVTVMNAIGPNLVVALLMDGPQLQHRWPGRYATVLAEDPGSAVLTLTSLGMVARSSMPGEPKNREIALWKEANGEAQVLRLPKGDHALLLTLTSRTVEQFTLDGRGDGFSTVQFRLGSVHGIRHSVPLPEGIVPASVEL